MKYLFKALFNDGSTVEQNQDDKSRAKDGKNAFYDVLQRMGDLRAFAFYNTETNDEYLTDLSDGRFEVNGASFYLHDVPISNIRLIYFKRNTVHVNVGADVEQLEPTYHFGFQANTANGSNLQRVLMLK